MKKFKEHGIDRARRLNLDKPHIYWSRKVKEWLAVSETVADGDDRPWDYCRAQDKRWTPRGQNGG